MKTIDNLSDNKLRELFKNMPQDSPSAGFTDSLLAKIEKEAARKRLKEQLFTMFWIASGVACIFGLSGLAMYLSGFDLLAVIGRSMENIRLNFLIVMQGLIVLLFLVLDTVIRQHVRHKRIENT